MARAFLVRLLAVLSATAVLAGCGLPERYKAAQDVRALLVAVQSDDRAAFEAHIDRPALRAELKQELGRVAARSSIAGFDLGGLLGSATGERVADEMISLESFRTALRGSAADLQRIPAAAQIALLIKITAPGEACLHDPRHDRCVLTFRDEAGTWRLTGVSASSVKIGSTG